MNGNTKSVSALRKKTQTMDFGDLYPGWEAVVWVNPPLKYIEMLQSGVAANVYSSINDLVTDWNFRDEKDNELKKDVKNIREHLPIDLIYALIDKITSAITSPKAKRPAD